MFHQTSFKHDTAAKTQASFLQLPTKSTKCGFV
jgi:hypothetical protein